MPGGSLLQTYVMLFLSLNKQNPNYYYDSTDKMLMIAYQAGDKPAMDALEWIKLNTHPKVMLSLRTVESIYTKLSRSDRFSAVLAVLGGKEIKLIDLQTYLDEARTNVEKIFVDIAARNDISTALPTSSVMSEQDMM